MSSEQYKNEADRWFRQVLSDLEAAQGSLQQKKYDWASFQAQQAGEKLLKAYWLCHGYDPWGHNRDKLIIDYPDAGTRQPIVQHCLMPPNSLIKCISPHGIPTDCRI
jgi:HEPN domain-containing protein